MLLARCRTLLLLALCVVAPRVAAEYHAGDFVPAARRGQFHGVRWSTALPPCRSADARLAPVSHAVARPAGEALPKVRAQQDSARLTACVCRALHLPRPQVALPLPRPTGFLAGDEYKLALSFDGDRQKSGWLTLLGKQAPLVPLVHVQFSHTGGLITAVHASTQLVPQSFTAQHAELIQEWTDPERWPKHVLVRYSWTELVTTDEVAGLYALLLTGFLLAAFAMAQAAMASARPLNNFFNQMTAEEDSLFTRGPKAEDDATRKAD